MKKPIKAQKLVLTLKQYLSLVDLLEDVSYNLKQDRPIEGLDKRVDDKIAYLKTKITDSE